MQKDEKKNPLLGFGFFRFVGWSVVIPTFGGLMIGLLLDSYLASPNTWSLILMFLGFTAGCAEGTYLSKKEKKRVEKEKEDQDKNS